MEQEEIEEAASLEIHRAQQQQNQRQLRPSISSVAGTSTAGKYCTFPSLSRDIL